MCSASPSSSGLVSSGPDLSLLSEDPVKESEREYLSDVFIIFDRINDTLDGSYTKSTRFAPPQ